MPTIDLGIKSDKEDDRNRFIYHNEWQLCPKCEGVGLHPPLMTSLYEISTAPVICDLCNRKKIISKVTGNPPA